MQTIGLLSHLWSKGIHGPFMVIGPLSTLSNWVSEFERFCPSLATVLYHGSKKDRADIRRKKLKLSEFSRPQGVHPCWTPRFAWCSLCSSLPAAGAHSQPSRDFPVVITSYEIVLTDIKFLQKLSWKYIIVDEGHRLKNWNCKLLRELKTLESANKLILSGELRGPRPLPRPAGPPARTPKCRPA